VSEECDDVLHERELREQWETAHLQVHQAEHRALVVAAKAVDERLTAMNEFRGQIKDERGTYPTRAYVDAVFSSIDTRFKALEQSKTYVIGWVAGVAAVAMLIMYFISRKP
jgi:hypothetical protein